jgi:hypothetical protein
LYGIPYFLTVAFSDAPARLKKELDMVLNLQGNLDTIDDAIQMTHTTISKSSPSKESLRLVKSLQETHEHLKTKVEALYASLNVHESFPELQGLDLEFVRTLLMARDLKINIRKRAVGSFFEWDKLDQAAGGRDQALGVCSYLLTSAHSGISGLQAQNSIKAHVRPSPNASQP